jgi:hypothetical protein
MPWQGEGILAPGKKLWAKNGEIAVRENLKFLWQYGINQTWNK